MEDHSKQVSDYRKIYVRVAGGLVLLCCFAVGLAFSIEFEKPAPTPPENAALSAAVAEALSAQNYYANISLIAQGAIVQDIDTGAVLYQRNADAQLPLASLTKVPLVLAVSEVLDPEAIVTIPSDTAYNSKATPLYAGEQLKAKDLISYTLVASSNDGAQTLAGAADDMLRAKYPQAGQKATVWRMNQLSKDLGLSSTYFLNPTGLDESETQSGAYGSARDMATLFTYAFNTRATLFSDTATTSIVVTSLDGHQARASNTDQVLDSMPGIIMGKTGYTDLAGGNLVVVFFEHGKKYVAAVLGSTEEGRFSDIRQLMAATEKAFADK
jgi:D-alanyl-D-alanine carboxypeptidase